MARAAARRQDRMERYPQTNQRRALLQVASIVRLGAQLLVELEDKAETQLAPRKKPVTGQEAEVETAAAARVDPVQRQLIGPMGLHLPLI